MIHCTRYHDISCGHRVVGHEGHCKNFHGHNYRIYFTCTTRLDHGKPLLDDVGRVIDFSVIKSKLCTWLDENWDHNFLMWEKDPFIGPLQDLFSRIVGEEDNWRSIVSVPFNPTAENIALFFIETKGPELLEGTGVVLTRCVVQETRKCSAEVELSTYH